MHTTSSDITHIFFDKSCSLKTSGIIALYIFISFRIFVFLTFPSAASIMPSHLYKLFKLVTHCILVPFAFIIFSECQIIQAFFLHHVLKKFQLSLFFWVSVHIILRILSQNHISVASTLPFIGQIVRIDISHQLSNDSKERTLRTDQIKHLNVIKFSFEKNSPPTCKCKMNCN